MLEIQRQQKLLELLDANQFMRVVDLTVALNASEATIRRDIAKLSEDKRLLKIRGGAQALADKEIPNKRLNSSAFWPSIEAHKAAKTAIAKVAVELCQDGDPIIINGGTSTYMMGQFLVGRKVNILTNSLILANDLVANTECQITLPGGEIYREQGIILSAFDDDAIPHYNAKYMFMGSPAINEQGVMESDPLLVRSERKLRKQAEKLVVLADSSKLGALSQFVLCRLEEIDILITDRDADSRFVARLQKQGVQVIIAPVNNT